MDHDLGGGRREPIGRERELGILERWLQAPRGSRVVFVHGELGIGKTTLWRRAIQLAAAAGCLVLVSRPARVEAGMRFAALADLLGDVPRGDLDALAGPLRDSLRAVLFEVGRDPGEKDEGPEFRPVSQGMLALLKRLTADRPVVVAIDDMQWMDEATAEIFRFVFRRLGSEPVLLLAMYGTGVFGLEREPTLPLEDVEEQLSTLRLRPLSDESLKWLLDRQGLEGWPRSLMLEAVRLSDGVPGLALALTPRPEGSDLEDPLVVPHVLTRWILARLSGVSDAAIETVRVAAHLLHPSVDLLARIVGRAAGQGLQEAAQTGLLEVTRGRVEFLRSAVAAALRQQTDAEGRRALHRRLSSAVAEPEEGLRHLALATTSPTESLARALEDASRAVRERGGDAAYGRRLAELALRATDPAGPERVARRRLLVAEWHLALGDSVAAAETFHDLASQLVPGRPERLRLLRRLAWLELWTRGVMDSHSRLAQGMSEVPQSEGLAAPLHCDLAFVRLLQGDLGESAQHAAHALHIATDPDVTARARSLLTTAGAAAGQAEWPRPGVPPEPGLSTAAPEDHWPALDLAARGRMHTDGATLPRPGSMRQTVSGGGEAQWLAWVAEAEYWRGLWSDAAALAERGVQLAAETGEWVAAVRLHHVTALIAADRGRLVQARAAARKGQEVAWRAGLEPLVTLNQAVLGYVEHAEGSTADAVEAFEPMLASQLPGPEPGLVRLFPNAVESLIEAGRVDLARDRLAALDACQQTLHARWLVASCARCHGMLAAAAGGLDEAEMWHRQAIETEEVAPRQLELGRHLLAAGVVERRRRHRHDAADALERAQRTFDALGADVWRSRAAAELSRLQAGHRAVRPAALTPHQQQIAELVAQGRSNKEVARALSVSVYTVESQLKVIYRKLGVTSRAALGYRLGEHPFRRHQRPAT